MSRSTAPFLAACVLAAGAGVAIAGVPSRASEETFTLVAGTSPTTPTTDPSIATRTATTAPTTTTEPATTEPATTVPESTTPASSAPESTAPASSAPESTAPASTAPVSSAPQSTETAEPLDLLVVNGAGSTGVAARGAELLVELGYPQALLADTVEPAAASTLYYASGREVDALAMKERLGLDSLPVLSEEQVPEHTRDDEYDLVLVLGSDYELILGE